MRSRLMHAWPLALVLVAAGCSTTTGGSSEAPSNGGTSAAPPSLAIGSLKVSIAPAASPTTAPTASPSTEPSAAAGGEASAPAGSVSPGDIDPCTLLTADEASRTIGVKLGAGVSSQLDPDRACTFRKGQTEVKLILAPKAPSAEVAKSYWDTERAQVPADVPINDLTVFDRSAYGSGSAGPLSLSALFVIDGDYFFDLVCMNPLCSEKASVGAADHIAGRLP